jgi:pimeloyl-ACP methyl ester carboxylesterase
MIAALPAGDVAGAGHAINLERPAEFAAALDDFLERTTRRAP